MTGPTWPGHVEQDAEGTEDDEYESNDEKEFDKSTGKKRNSGYTGYQKYGLIKEWVTREDAVLEEADIQHEIYSRWGCQAQANKLPARTLSGSNSAVRMMRTATPRTSTKH